MGLIIRGKVWKFGDHVNTDYMHPSFASKYPWDELKKHVLHIHKEFTRGCRPGDVIVAGKNFGCGSSREAAPDNLKRLGIGCIVAESFGRIFFRNCIAIALPVMACRGICDIFAEGDTLELDFEKARVRNVDTGAELNGPVLSEDLIQIVRSGGILASLGGKKPAARLEPMQ